MKREQKGFTWRFFKTVKGILSMMIAAALTAECIYFYLNSQKKEQVDTEYLINTLQKSSELTSATLNYKGFSRFTDTGWVIWNKSDFSIMYEAKVRAGIDLSQVKVSADDNAKTIYVAVPKASIQDVKIDESTIEYYDVDFSLFNWDARDDANRVIAQAEEEASSAFADMGVLEFADSSAKEVVTGLLVNAVPKDYTLNVMQAED